MTISQAVQKARIELPDMSDAVAYAAADSVHRRLCALLPELCRDVITIPLVAGLAEYDLDQSVIQTEGGVFLPAGGSSSDAIAVLDESVETIRARNREFRVAPPTDWIEQPPSMYVSTKTTNGVLSLVVGFSPPPDTLTATGTLTLNVSKAPTNPVAPSTPLLPGLHSSRVYVEGILYHGARAIRPDAVAGFKSLYEAEILETGALVRTRVEGAKNPSEANVRSNNG